MKVYFTASLKGDKKIYEKITQILTNSGYKLVTDHILKRKIEEVEKEKQEESERYTRKMMSWIKKSDIVISEVSVSDVSVGYEITISLNLGKPVIVLYTKENEPHALKGLSNDRLQVCSYNMDNLKDVLEDALGEAKNQMDVRFNFFISPKIGVYLDWISKNKKLPRAVFLRRLIEEHMKKNKEYKS